MKTADFALNHELTKSVLCYLKCHAPSDPRAANLHERIVREARPFDRLDELAIQLRSLGESDLN